MREGNEGGKGERKCELGRENEGSKGGGESIDIKRGKQLSGVWGRGVQLKNQGYGHTSYAAVNSLEFGYYTYMLS